MNYHYQGFVGREKELDRLSKRLSQAVDQAGGIFFVSGEGGSGKSALLNHFTEQAQEDNKKLVVAISNCNAQSGISDPFLPFREILELLTGNTKSKLAKGQISAENAGRIKGMGEFSARILLEAAPDLIGSLIPGGVILGALGKVVADKTGLTDKIKRSTEESAPIEQSQIFEQYTNFVLGISQKAPLLLIIDDLQWADEASISLLFHLSRRLEEANILLLCAYRSDEVALGRGGERHPLDKVLNEFKRYYGDILIDLESEDSGEKRRLIDDYIDLEPNALDDTFRQALLKQTKGHPLFFVELLHYMVTGEDLVQNKKGEWIEGKKLNWTALPARVEGVIEERIGRLDAESRELLQVASVEGEEFTAQVLSIIQSNDELSIVRKLSGELQKQHRLVLELGKKQIANNTLSLFQFSHNLYQQYLYSGLGEEERRLLHKAVAHALEDLNPDNLAALAYHYSKAEEAEKAVHYLLLVADRARQLYAVKEAIDHYLQALEFLKEMGNQEQSARTLMNLAISYQNNFDFKASNKAYQKAFALQQGLGETGRVAQLPPAPHAFRFVHPEPNEDDLDPTLSNSQIISQLFSGLMEMSPTGDFLPDVAHSWEVLEEGKRYVFHLREDVYWSDGVPVRARDFDFAFKHILDAKTDSDGARYFYDIKNGQSYHQGKLSDAAQVGVRAKDEHSLEIELEKPTSYFLQVVSDFFPIPEHVFKKHGNEWTKPSNFVSNGAFLLASRERGKSMLLEQNPKYHRRFRGNLEKVELSFAIQSENKLQAYIEDKHDIMRFYGIPADHQDLARRRHSDEYYTFPRSQTAFIGFDPSVPPFDDVNVRRAFALATDQESLAGKVYAGQVSPAIGGFVPPGLPGHSPKIGLPFDPDEARMLLAKAGYPGGRGFPVIEAINSIMHIKDLSEYLESQWLDILGVKIDWQTMDFDEYHDQIGTGKHSLWTAGNVAGFADPHSFLSGALWNTRKDNSARWTHPEYKALIGKATRILNQDERIDLYRRADQLLIEEAPIVPLFHFRYQFLVKPWVKGFVGTPFRATLYKDVIIEPH